MSRIPETTQGALLNLQWPHALVEAFAPDWRREVPAGNGYKPLGRETRNLAVWSSHFEGRSVLQHLLLTSPSGGLVRKDTATYKHKRNSVGVTKWPWLAKCERNRLPKNYPLYSDRWVPTFRTLCLRRQISSTMGAADFFETLVHVTKLHGVTSRKTVIYIVDAMLGSKISKISKRIRGAESGCTNW